MPGPTCEQSPNPKNPRPPEPELDLQSVGTEGFEYNGLHAGPLFFQHKTGEDWRPRRERPQLEPEEGEG